MAPCRWLAVVCVLVAWWPAAAFAQDTARAAPAQLDRTLRVFIDCRAPACDEQFFRTELTWFDHVRDQQDADVHVLVTSQGTGGGGTEYTIRFIGRGLWEGQEDTLLRATEASATEDARRRELVQVFGLGLARYAARTPAGKGLKIEPPETGISVQTAAASDPWNYWVFRTNVNTFFDGEASSSSQSVNVNQSANRTTEFWKVNFGAGINYNTSDYVLSDGTTYTSIRKGWFANSLVVKSLGEHWSIGGRAGASRSTYLNQQLAVRVAPAVEFNFFPYSESNQRQLTLQWSVGANHYRYDEETIYGVMEETRFDEVLIAHLSLRQPFGTVRITNEVAHFFEDFGQYRYIFSIDNELRVTRGLSLNIDGNYAILHDQIYLQRGEATDEEILVRQRQLETSYRYFFFVGVTYRFGSINNNVVNPRFSGPGG